jgi:hypothetical protein
MTFLREAVLSLALGQSITTPNKGLQIAEEKEVARTDLRAGGRLRG